MLSITEDKVIISVEVLWVSSSELIWGLELLGVDCLSKVKEVIIELFVDENTFGSKGFERYLKYLRDKGYNNVVVQLYTNDNLLQLLEDNPRFLFLSSKVSNCSYDYITIKDIQILRGKVGQVIKGTYTKEEKKFAISVSNAMHMFKVKTISRENWDSIRRAKGLLFSEALDYERVF